MTLEEIGRHRLTLQEEFGKLLGIKYKFGAKWDDMSKPLECIDCSGAVSAVFKKAELKMPEGSGNQFDFTIALAPGTKPQVGDLGFFSKNGIIDHVGMIYDANNMIEARAFDKLATFKTGEVILRPISKWTAWKEFAGFRTHPDLQWIS